jgi:hypothetical protein
MKAGRKVSVKSAGEHGPVVVKEMEKPLQLVLSPNSDRLVMEARVLFKMFGHGVAPYELVAAPGDSDKTGEFLSQIWTALADSDPPFDRDPELASLLGALLATVVARQLPLTPNPRKSNPDFFTNIDICGQFGSKFCAAFSSIVPWDWFMMLSTEERMSRLFKK